MGKLTFQRLVIRCIRGYRDYLSLDHGWLGRLWPYRGRVCRFEPSCSAYAMDAIDTFGLWRGGWMSLRRLGRCHPWGGSGWDPVPGR